MPNSSWLFCCGKVAVLEFHKLLFAFVLVNRVVVCNDAFAVKSSLSRAL